MKLDILFDRSQSIRESVADVEHTLFLAVCLVVMVIFIFLRNLSATLIPSLALPMSIIGTFAAMALLGYSLDNLSLMALTLCVGFVVDDAIVMLENIVRHMENGEPPMQAALNGSKEIGFTIISMTLSLSAVFIPVLFMSGLLGRLLHEFAVTIVVRGAGVRIRFADADADDVQPVRAFGARTEARQSFTTPSSVSSTGCAALTTARLQVGHAPSARDADRVSLAVLVATAGSCST